MSEGVRYYVGIDYSNGDIGLAEGPVEDIRELIVKEPTWWSDVHRSVIVRDHTGSAPMVVCEWTGSAWKRV